MTLIDILKPLRGHAGKLRTGGLDDATLLALAKRFPELTAAAEAAIAEYGAIKAEFADLLDLDEQAQIDVLPSRA